MYPSESNPATQKILIFAGVGVLVFLFIIFIVITTVAKPKDQAAQPTPSPVSTVDAGSNNLFGNAERPTRTPNTTVVNTTPLPTMPPKEKQTVAGSLAKIGDEIIYNSDLSEELASYPPTEDSSLRERLFAKMVDDSITLQGALKMKLMTLDSSVYNSNSKDYTKRIKAVADAKQKIDDNADGYSGMIVQIWFYNQKPPRVGYAQGRQIATQKINELHDKVKSGAMTMEQAGDAIRSDSNLYNVDEAFRINASFPFLATKEKPATFDKGFNTILAGLKAGQVSDVYIAKDKDENGTMIDAVAMFGKVDKIVTKNGYTSYDTWLAQQKKSYEVVTY
jgi:hypothetical protein